MTNVEHLLETGLKYIEDNSYDEWKCHMQDNINWLGVAMTLDELWYMCRYIFYVRTPEIVNQVMRDTYV